VGTGRELLYLLLACVGTGRELLYLLLLTPTDFNFSALEDTLSLNL